MTQPFPLLLGSVLDTPDGGDEPLLFYLNMEEDISTLRAVTLRFQVDIVPVVTGGRVKMVEVPLEEVWPVPAKVYVLIAVRGGADTPADLCAQTQGEPLYACPVPGTDPPLVSWSFPVPPGWLMPADPYIKLAHREDLAARVDRCIAEHRRRFEPET